MVAAESDGQLSLARMSVNALGHLLVDLRARRARPLSISCCLTQTEMAFLPHLGHQSRLLQLANVRVGTAVLGSDRLAELVGADKVDLPTEVLDVADEAGLDQLQGASLCDG